LTCFSSFFSFIKRGMPCPNGFNGIMHTVYGMLVDAFLNILFAANGKLTAMFAALLPVMSLISLICRLFLNKAIFHREKKKNT